MTNLLVSRKLRVILTGIMMFFIGTSLYARERHVSSLDVEIPFNVNEIIENSQGISRNGEFLIDTSVVYVPSPNRQFLSSVAFDGTNYLIAWYDKRNASFDIYAARVSQDGMVLDSAGIAISTAGCSQGCPSVAFDGTNYLVVWSDSRNASFDIYGARLNQDGMVLDPDGIAISTATGIQGPPSVAFDGTNYLVVWNDKRSGVYDIYGTRVGQDGTVLDPAGIAICTATGSEMRSSVTFGGTNYLVVWDDTRSGSYDIYGARVGQDGTVLDPAGGIAISTATNWQMFPSVVFNGTNCLVVWNDSRSGSYDIYGARVGQDGTVLDPAGIAISTVTGSHQRKPSVTFDGTNCLVVWDDNRSGSLDIYGARLNQDGTVLDPAGIAISTAGGSQEYAKVAFSGTNYLVVWNDTRKSSYDDIYGARVGQDGTVLDPAGILISTAAYIQRYPSVAFDGSNYLVVWNEERNSPYDDIYGARVNQNGTVLDPAGILISTADSIQECPSVAFDGTNYLVVWQDLRNGLYPFSADIYGARVSQDGTVLDPDGIAISTADEGQLYPSVAFDGTNYLVVWHDARSGLFFVYGARVNQNGTVLDPDGIVISTADATYPSVAFNGTNCLVVWDAAFDIYGARVNQNGTVLDPDGIVISTATNWQCMSSLAFDGTNCLVVWQDTRNGIVYDIYGARVSQDGTVLDPAGIAISTAGGGQLYPSVAFDGTNYQIVWQDARNGTFYDIYGAWVDTLGAVIYSQAVSTQSGNQLEPTLTKGASSQILVTYSGFTDSVNSHPANTMRIWGKFYPIIGVEETRNNQPKVEYGLQVFPNPFRDRIDIRYIIPDNLRGPEKFSLKIYDISGRIIKDLTNGFTSVVRWNGTDDLNREVPTGVYLVKLQSDGYQQIRKIVLLH